jgi:hypothetical protein
VELNEVHLSHASAAKAHFVISQLSDGGLALEDLGSAWGTTINVSKCVARRSM